MKGFLNCLLSRSNSSYFSTYLFLSNSRKSSYSHINSRTFGSLGFRSESNKVPSKETDDESIWKRNFSALVEYFKAFGHLEVKKSPKFSCTLPNPDGGKDLYKGDLYLWFMKQKLLLTNKSMLPHRKKQLKSLLSTG
jgi:hypothetical protein